MSSTVYSKKKKNLRKRIKVRLFDNTIKNT